MFLYLRMLLYLVSGIWAGNADFVVFDQATGDLTVNMDDLGHFLSGLAGFAVTWIASRWAKARGGAT